MGVIAAFLGTIFSGISGLFTVFLARKAVFSLAYIAVYLALTAVLITATNAAIASVQTSLPTNSFLLAGLSLLPSNTAQCIGIISTAHVAAFAFRFKDKLLSFKVNA